MRQQSSSPSIEVSPRPGRRAFLGLVGAGLVGVAGAAGTGTAAASTGQRPEFPYLDRAGWGADESRRFADGVEKFPPVYYPLQTLTVHHTALAGGTDHHTPDPAAMMRNLYRNMTGGDANSNYGDFGYHFMIDEAGVVYEGRYSGEDGTPALDPAGRVVTAAHIGGWNSGNLGIVMLGNFNNWCVTRAARRSLTQLLASLAGPQGLDPLGTTGYVNPVNGTTKTVPTISGHDSWVVTDCPGSTFKPLLPAIRNDVAALLA